MTVIAIGLAFGWSAIGSANMMITLFFSTQDPAGRIGTTLVLGVHVGIVVGLWPLVWGGAP